MDFDHWIDGEKFWLKIIKIESFDINCPTKKNFGGNQGWFMGEDLIIKLGQDAMRTTALIAGPMLVATLVVGLLISIFQALTQINEATLTFIPKMIVVTLIIIFAGPWMLDVMAQYTINLFESVATFVRE